MKKIIYLHTSNYDKDRPDGGYSEGRDFFIADDEGETLGGILEKLGKRFDLYGDEYIILDVDGKPTGERYFLSDIEIVRGSRE